MLRQPQTLTTDQAKAERIKILTANEKKYIPGVLKLRPESPADGYLCLPDKYPPLRPQVARVKVIDRDAYEIAIDLTKENTKAGDKKLTWIVGPGGRPVLSEHPYCDSQKAILLWKAYQVVYSPTVIIFRTRGTKDYNCEYPLMDFNHPQDFPVVSVVSVAAIYKPKVDSKANPPTWAKAKDWDLMYEKIWIALRICAHNGHRSIVLGALGAGVFGNPSQAVTIAFREVLQEPEFRARFDNIVFAVLQDNNKCYDVFHKELDGVQV
ncbi:hypothetical protein BDW74DRAFT_172108 [Aspergillus multicolor]|uniref:uncharacterized protein n=1 Tax=Aspergillus multicolor TaxID=41759 RepID=UPI003CCDC9E0